MKKIAILWVMMFLGVVAFAQDDPVRDDFDNEFYFRFGYSIPSWTQFGATESDWEEGIKRSGYSFEIGTIFMLKSVKMPEGMALGINVDYLSMYYHQFSFLENNVDFDVATLRADSKVGPSFTYSPVNKLAFDVYAKADISWYTVTALIENNDMDDADYYTKSGALGFSTGLNVRYSILMIGFEYNTISPALENRDHPGVYLGNVNDIGSDKSPLPSVNFTLGLSF